jgi:hypothetical protein
LAPRGVAPKTAPRSGSATEPQLHQPARATLLRVGERVVARSSQQPKDQRSDDRCQSSKSLPSGRAPRVRDQAARRTARASRSAARGQERRCLPLCQGRGPVVATFARSARHDPLPQGPGGQCFCSLTSVICHLPFAGWSSPVARQAHNLKVAGSNPAPATKISPLTQKVTGLSHV